MLFHVDIKSDHIIYTNDLWKLTAAAEHKESISAVLPRWFAHGFTNWCQPGGRISSSKVIGPETCAFLQAERNMPPLQYVRHYSRTTLGMTGWVVHEANDSSWLEVYNRSRRHKYCTPYGNSHDESGESIGYQRLHGVTLVLSEAHGNTNIGHASRDQLFVAHFLSQFHENEAVPVRRIILADPLGGSGRALKHRMEGLRALTIGFGFDVFDVKSFTPNASCHDVVLQKINGWTGSREGGRFYQRRAVGYCGLSAETLRDQHVLLEVHAQSRSWHNMSWMVEQIKRQRWADGLEVLPKVMDGLSFCEQVKLFAQARVAILHHGAAVAGNGVFMPDDGILVELCAQYNMSNVLWYQSAEPIFTDCGNREWAKAVGRNYIGSASAFWAGHEGEAVGSYYFKRGSADKVEVNRTRWLLTMDAISHVRRSIPYSLIPVPSPQSPPALQKFIPAKVHPRNRSSPQQFIPAHPRRLNASTSSSSWIAQFFHKVRTG